MEGVDQCRVDEEYHEILPSNCDSSRDLYVTSEMIYVNTTVETMYVLSF